MTPSRTSRLLTRRRFQSAGRTPELGVPGGPRRIVLTGGPGSGKSTAAAFLAREFVDELWVLPESATLLYRGGLPRATSPLGQQVAQRAIYTVQRSLEDAAALRHPGRVQLCDRSTIDGATYWPDGPDAFFASIGTPLERELARYEAVVFLRTAALLPAGYERDQEIRTESREEAIELDRRLLELYSAHPRLVCVASSASFLDKLTIVRDAVANIIRGDHLSLAPEPKPPTLLCINGDASEDGLDAAPISSLMGLASVGHVLPVDD